MITVSSNMPNQKMNGPTQLLSIDSCVPENSKEDEKGDGMVAPVANPRSMGTFVQLPVGYQISLGQSSLVNLSEEPVMVDMTSYQDKFMTFLAGIKTDQESFKVSHFLEPEKNKVDAGVKLQGAKKIVSPSCSCNSSGYDRAPSYTHFGAGPSLQALREIIEKRTNYFGEAIRLERVLYTQTEGKTEFGCPIAKWILRRSGPHEKILALVRFRPGHVCSMQWIIMVIVVWDGIPGERADDLYDTMSRNLGRVKMGTDRGCRTNKSRNCACQGVKKDTCGVCFSFGCSWSPYSHGGCKYASSIAEPKKFRLPNHKEVNEVEAQLQSLADYLAPMYRQFVPEAYENQVASENSGKNCRLGTLPGRPFSGVTVCMDFCAHSHRDRQNMDGGCTTLVTLTKHRGLQQPEDEQFHVLPKYVLDPADEFGDDQAYARKMSNGSLQLLRSKSTVVRLRKVPLEKRERKKQTRHPESACNPWHTLSLDAKTEAPLCASTSSARTKGSVLPLDDSGGFTEVETSHLQYFLDGYAGGVALALSHGSVMFECAKLELHASTPLRNPNRLCPTRIGLVLYQHMDLNRHDHGRSEFLVLQQQREANRQRMMSELKSKNVFDIKQRTVPQMTLDQLEAPSASTKRSSIVQEVPARPGDQLKNIIVVEFQKDLMGYPIT